MRKIMITNFFLEVLGWLNSSASVGRTLLLSGAFAGYRSMDSVKIGDSEMKESATTEASVSWLSFLVSIKD
jgi:hypothetical protein